MSRRKGEGTPAGKRAARTLVPLPIITFGDAAAIGYGARVYCPNCYRTVTIDPVAPSLRDRPFPGARFRCSANTYLGYPCRAPGHLHLSPPDHLFVPPGRAIRYWNVTCGGCWPWPWEIDQARPDQPPWSALARGEMYRCLACRRRVHCREYGQSGIPFTDGYWRDAKGR